MTNQIQRKIAIKDYYGKGDHVYEDEMGFRDRMKSEARSLVAREVFRYHVEEVGLNLGFYYPPHRYILRNPHRDEACQSKDTTSRQTPF